MNPPPGPAPRYPTTRAAFDAAPGWHKLENYFEVYDRYLAPRRDGPVTMLEIGVDRGGSITGWRNYFGEALIYHGVDVAPACAAFAREGVAIHLGDQGDPGFLAELAERLPPLDIVIDDGGHRARQQILSFEALWDRVKDGGVYIIEDTHTAFWREFGRYGLHRGRLYTHGVLDYAAGLTRNMMEWWWSIRHHRGYGTPREAREAPVPVGRFARSIHAIAFHDGMIVIEKRAVPEPLRIYKE